MRAIFIGRSRDETQRLPVRKRARTLRHRLLILGTATLSAALWANACGDGATEPPPPPPDPPRATSLTVAPVAVALTAFGASVQLSAEVRDQNGTVMAGTSVTWSSGNADVATVDATGLVTAAGNGTATITAQAGSASGSATVTVAAESPDRGTLVALYEGTDGPNWLNNEGWLTDAPLGEWYGVETDASERVVSLDLAGEWDNEARQWIRHGLSGPIPPELGNLGNLKSLHLGVNYLIGPIPPELGRLSGLWELDLYFNQLTGEIPPEIGNLVNLTDLDFGGNGLTGQIPPAFANLAKLQNLGLRANQLTGEVPSELGGLANLRGLDVKFNNLTGSIPHAYLQLDLLTTFSFGENAGLCAPGSGDFARWLGAIERHDGPLCNAADRAVLESLYDATRGTAWTRSDNWLSAHAVGEWHGVSADSLGMVTALDLAENGLAGRLAPSIAGLAQMTVLRIGGNALSGRLPLSLAAVPLQELHYGDTELCAPAQESFQAWLNAIPSHQGTAVECAPLSDREILEVLYHATGGPDWTRSTNWLTDAPLSDWHGVTTNGDGRVTALHLYINNLAGSLPGELGSLARLQILSLFQNRHLTGPIPPELGNLARMKELSLQFTDLTGPIPRELGQLSELRHWDVWRARLSGPIPPELGNMSSLTVLGLGENQLTGEIPSELGKLQSLQGLYLVRNALTGPIPPELGDLSQLQLLSLDQNDLTGTLPPELGRLTNLQELGVANNATMSGVLPASLTALRELDVFGTGGTGLCAPADPAFQAWLAGIRKRRVAACDSGDASAAYLVQAVQSRDNPVPLVAGERALLRVFLTARQATGESIPAVLARFYLDGRETHVQHIPGKLEAIPTEVDEGDLSKSVNAEIPGSVVQPGLEMVIEIDPAATLDSTLAVARRIPDTGRLAVEVWAMPTLDLTVVPFLWTDAPDSAILDITSGMAADPENHEILWATRTLLPVGDLDVRAHEPVLTATNNAGRFFDEAVAIRALEGGTGHYMAMMSGNVDGPGGFAQGNRLSFARPWAPFIAHELGHNMSLEHAPCGSASGLDRGFPYPDGSIGVWGYDFEGGGTLASPIRPDIMGYCRSKWVSDYHFTNALRYRLVDEGAPEAAAIAQSTKSLLLWGGIGTDSVLFLEPAFVVDAPTELPQFGGEYRITGQDVDGATLFSLSFGMPEVADGDGSSSFAFVLPARSWVGGQPGQRHAHRARRFVYAGRRQQPPHGDPAQSTDGTDSRLPARSAGGRRNAGGSRTGRFPELRALRCSSALGSRA